MKQRLLTYAILAFLVALFSYGMAYAEDDPLKGTTAIVEAPTVDIEALQTDLNIQIIILKSLYWDITQVEKAIVERFQKTKDAELAPLLERKLEVENKIKELRGEIEAAK